MPLPNDLVPVGTGQTAPGDGLPQDLVPVGVNMPVAQMQPGTYQNKPAVGLIKGVSHPDPQAELEALQASTGNVAPATENGNSRIKNYALGQLHQMSTPESGGLIGYAGRSAAELSNSALQIPSAVIGGLGGYLSGLGSPQQLNNGFLLSAGAGLQNAGNAINPASYGPTRSLVEPKTAAGQLPAAVGQGVGATFNLAGQGYRQLAEAAGVPRAGAVLGNTVSNLPILAPLAAGAYETATGGLPKIGKYEPTPLPAGLQEPGATPTVPAPQGGIAAPFTNPKKVVAPLLQEIAGDDPAIIERLKNPTQYVPGSVPTTAQVLGTTKAVQLEKQMRGGEFADEFYKRDAQNTAAQLQYLGEFSGTPQEISAARANRAQAAAPWTDPQKGLLHTSAPVDVTPIIDQLAQMEQSEATIRPASAKAVAAINEMVRNRAQLDEATGAMTMRPSELDALRQNANDYLYQFDPRAVHAQASTLFQPLRNTITDTIDAAIPGYKDYLRQYAINSQPINTMEAVNTFQDWAQTRKPLMAAGPGAQVPQLTFPQTAGKLADLSESGRYEISPEAQARAEAISRDMQRSTLSNAVRAAGSDTQPRLQTGSWLARRIYGPEFEGPGSIVKGVAAAAGGAATGGFGGAAAVHYGLGKLSSAAASRVNQELAKALANPSYAASILEEYSPKIPAAGPRVPVAPASPVSPVNAALAAGLMNRQQP